MLPSTWDFPSPFFLGITSPSPGVSELWEAASEPQSELGVNAMSSHSILCSSSLLCVLSYDVYLLIIFPY